MRHLRSAVAMWLTICALLLTEGLVSDLGPGVLGPGYSGKGVVLARPAGTEGDSVVVKPGQSLFLEPNFPNPFDKTTKIAYTLDRETTVTLTIFDAFYNDVRTLVDELPQTPGRYVVEFNPSGEFASTMYFYSLKTNAGIETRRMMLVR